MSHSPDLNSLAQPLATQAPQGAFELIVRWLLVASAIYLLLVAVNAVGSGFKIVSGGATQTEQLLAIASNPFAALLIGILVTSLVQSSSTVTSVIVGLVAGGLPIETAIPMVMGANIGTTVTNTIVSMAHISDRQSFKQALAAATIHDFFNFLNVCIFLPLEMIFQPLEKMSYLLANTLAGGTDFNVKDYGYISSAIKSPVGWIKESTQNLPSDMSALLLIIAGVLMIFLSVMLLSHLLKQLLQGNAVAFFQYAVGKGPVRGMTSGAVLTVLCQSSSTTTSLLVPFAGNGVFSLRQVYPFTLGANIGTCITALFAAMAISGDGIVFALQIALVHLLFNLCGALVIYSIPILRAIPLTLAETLGEVASKHKPLAIGYMILLFYIVPSMMVWLSIGGITE